MDLQTRYPLGRCGFGNHTESGGALLRVGEVLEIEDLEFPILLDEREDVDGVVVVRGTEDGGDNT